MVRDVLLHLPHASTHVPEDARREMVLTDEELHSETIAMVDLHTDELFSIANSERMVAPVSRLVVDVERFPDDADEVMASRGMGAVYERTHDGRPLRGEFDRRRLMRAFYFAHHAMLDNWAAHALVQHGRGLIIDGHSFPSCPLPCDLDQSKPRPQICLGTDPCHTSKSLRASAALAFESEGFEVWFDRPFTGTMVPAGYYGREPALQSIMVEVRRDLIQDEATGARRSDFHVLSARVRRALTSVVAAWRASA